MHTKYLTVGGCLVLGLLTLWLDYTQGIPFWVAWMDVIRGEIAFAMLAMISSMGMINVIEDLREFINDLIHPPPPPWA